ncbi:hypothetical protein IWZ03DRAFT_394931 [Phyllosticta citriasiana]|uniref:deoxyribose-phosphate aldolase n=1 Tax=Phyllosticta citriasiana TaxID=595635 RepID=A0ABR1KP60_9PEZI
MASPTPIPIPSPTDTRGWTSLTTSLLSQLEAAGALAEAPASLGHDVHLAPPQMARLIDHTLLKLDATGEQVRALCEEARSEGFATVCVRLGFVEQAVALLEGSGVGVACVVGFHEGTYSTEEKVAESRAAIAAGATELDIVLNWPLLQTQPDPSYAAILSDLHALRAAAPRPTVLKLIFETSQLSPLQIVTATALAAAAGFDCIKTSTGFNGRGASVQDVRLMKGALGLLGSSWEGTGRMFVKASGGVRSAGELKRVVAVGAGRIGTSSGVKIGVERRGRGCWRCYDMVL